MLPPCASLCGDIRAHEFIFKFLYLTWAQTFRFTIQFIHTGNMLFSFAQSDIYYIYFSLTNILLYIIYMYIFIYIISLNFQLLLQCYC